MYLTNEQLQKKLNQAKQKAIAKLLERNRYYIERELTPLVLVDNGLSIPYRPRLGIFKGRNNKVQYNPKTGDAHSYGWWRFVAVIDKKVVFNEYRYSATTRTHQAAVRNLLSELGIKIDYTVCLRESLSSEIFYNKSLEHFYRSLYEAENNLARSIKKSIYHLAIRFNKASIAELRKAGCTFSTKRQKELRKEVNDRIELELKRKREQRQQRSTSQNISF